MSAPTCPACGSDNRIGVELFGVYDGVLYWECAECGTAYQRWADDERMAQRAAPWIEKHNRDNQGARQAGTPPETPDVRRGQ